MGVKTFENKRKEALISKFDLKSITLKIHKSQIKIFDLNNTVRNNFRSGIEKGT
jgi:hypothetical protein